MTSEPWQSPSQPASKTGGASKTPEHTPILVDAKQASAMLSIGTRQIWTLTNCGAIPCVRIGRSVRYRVADLNTWAAAGCPTQPSKEAK